MGQASSLWLSWMHDVCKRFASKGAFDIINYITELYLGCSVESAQGEYAAFFGYRDSVHIISMLLATSMVIWVIWSNF